MEVYGVAPTACSAGCPKMDLRDGDGQHVKTDADVHTRQDDWGQAARHLAYGYLTVQP